MAQHDLWTCPQCGLQQDLSALGFHVEIACPQCETRAFVHSMLANYKIDSVLGIGGMSVVFRARDLVLGRPLAIKVLNDTYRDEPERIAGLENECALMAKVRHENVVNVYSAGWSRGQFYIAMELVDGRNLELIVAERGFLLPADALEIVRQVALGLQSAHDAGLLHRDVKPGNVLITPEGQAKVLDFGLSLEDKPDVETEDVIWATPFYVPPETLHREAESCQTDIYALGMTLRNLLTGESTLPGNPQTLSEMVVAKKTLPGIETVAPHLIPRLCQLVNRMTSYESADRPADYDELLKEIAETQAELVEALDPEERARRYRRKLYATAGGLGSVAIGLIGGFLVALMTPSGRVQDALDAEVMHWEDRDAYADAETQLRAGNFARAAELFASLTKEDKEPAMAASAAIIRTALDVLDDKSTENGYNRFEDISRRGDRVSPAGRKRFDELCSLVRSLEDDYARAAQAASGMPSSSIKVAAQILAADRYVHKGRHADAAELITKILDGLKESNLTSLNEQVDEYRMAAPRRAARVALGEARKLFHTGRLEMGSAMVDDLLKLKISRLEKEEIRVLGEAASIMLVARETLRKRGVYGITPTTLPDELLRMAKGISNAGNLAPELYALALILHGDYNEAFKVNPYANQPDSNEPFAVLMRDWKKRLEK